MATTAMASKPQTSDQTRKYQLFPKGTPAATPTFKSLDPEQAFALAMKNSENGAGAGGSVRIRKDVSLSARRRKISVPELGPMTTVQEAAMDSPTIPGLRPVHERSSSAPGGPAWRNHVVDFASNFLPITKEQKVLISEFAAAAALEQSESPVKSGALTPLVIPKANRSNNNSSNNVSSRFRSGSSPSENASYVTNRGEAAPVAHGQEKDREVRCLPQLWDRAMTPPAGSPPPVPIKLDQSKIEPSQNTATRIMDRGRPRKRSHSCNGSSVDSPPSSSSCTDSPKRSISSERRAFESLPQGYSLSHVVSALSGPELLALRSQAIEQSMRFEILRSKDVDALSKELRALDERVEYLRATYTSLRAGRRNLHGRILTLLKSGSRFGTEALLKQEEALAELDSSIDEWLAKLDVAENRRTRVRQKLLEHVAAAAMIPVMQPSSARSRGTIGHGSLSTPPRSPIKGPSPPAALRDGADGEINRRVSTPPLRGMVPSTIFEVPIEEERKKKKKKKPIAQKASSPTIAQQATKQTVVISPIDSLVSPMGYHGGRTESIMIFAAENVYGRNGTTSASLHDAVSAATSPPTKLTSSIKRAASHRVASVSTTIQRAASQHDVSASTNSPPQQKQKPTTAARRIREREMHRSRSYETLPLTTFESPRKSPQNHRSNPSAIVKPLTITKKASQPDRTAAPLSSRDDGVNSDTEVVYLTSAVFSG